MEVENVNMKKLFPENKVTRKGLLEFLDKKGFYIILVLCIAIVGVTAAFVMLNPGTPKVGVEDGNIIPDDASNDVGVSGTGKATAESSIQSVPSVAVSSSGTKPADTTKAAEPNKAGEVKTPAAEKNDAGQTAPQKEEKTTAPSSPKPATDKKTSSTTVKPDFMVPVSGNVTLPYAMKELVYSKTLDERRFHSGVDIEANRGTTVKATADGVVSDIKSDPRLGIMVILTHKNGYKTVYANLASDDVVSVNQKVKQGDIIGSVGNTAFFESADENHLHFEVWKNDEPVDPSTFLLKK
jgi:murein DD-endopeptidase MepM/ murein hydrolase activator NlpD